MQPAVAAYEERNVISRQWRGLAHPERAQDYVRHLRTETFPALREIPGFVDASILSRTLATGTEFQIVTRWDSIEAIVKFAGADPEAAVVPPQVVEMMVEYDARTKHFEVLA
jgi:heme-degrading monooxygenase HmoA